MLKEVLGVLLSMGGWYRLCWVWMERCRDGSYAVNALHCDVWVVCAGSMCMHCGVHCRLFHWFLGKCFLVEVHPYMTCFCTFWQSAFSVTCFGVFSLGGGNKCVGVNVCGVGMVLK